MLRTRWLVLGSVALVLVALVVLLPYAEYWAHPVVGSREPPSPRALELHGSSVVVDLHADSLVFGRDLLQRSRLGHVDVPRLLEGGVALQFFTVPTKAPYGLNIDRTDGRNPDMLTIAAPLLRWPPSTWFSPTERAVYQARRLESFVERSGGKLVWVRNQRELSRLLEARRRGSQLVGALLGIEGAHALEGDLTNLDRLYDVGLRMVGLTHFFDNEFAGSAHGLERGGLTDLGRALVPLLERRGVLVDLAHASPRTIEEVLSIVSHPTVVSHTGVRATCDNNRNLSDEQITAIAAGGGVIGIGFWPTAVCGTASQDVARAIGHVVDLVGDEYVALGSDYDGGTTVGFDASQLAVLTDALQGAGLAEASIRRILGENVLRVVRAVLPTGTESDGSRAAREGG